MKGTKILGIVIIIFSIIFFILLTLLFINSRTAKCDEGHTLDNSTGWCYYQANICRPNEIITAYASTNMCMYKPKGIFNSPVFYYSMILSGFILFVCFVIMIFLLSQKAKGKERLPPDDAIDAAIRWFAERHSMRVVDGKPAEGLFRINPIRHRKKITDDEFIRFNFEVLDGEFQNYIITMEVSLYYTVDQILKGEAELDEMTYWEYKRPKGFTHEGQSSPTDKLLEKLEDINPEKAAELRESQTVKQIESGAGSANPPGTPSMNPEEGGQEYPQRIQPQRQGYRRYIPPYRRRTAW